MLELKSTWGELAPDEMLDPGSCWALRRGHTHFVPAGSASLACRHVRAGAGDSICIPMSAHGDTIGMLHLTGCPSQPVGLTDAKRQLAVPVAEQTSLALSNIELRERLRTQALRDPLTRLHNRRFADEWMAREVARTDRAGRSLGVIMIDIDHFKEVNDVHGHEAGDEVLRAIAELFGRSLRRDVAEMRVEYRRTTLPAVTMSAGVAMYPAHGSTAAEVIAAADIALYAAKHGGRNRTVVPG